MLLFLLYEAWVACNMKRRKTTRCVRNFDVCPKLGHFTERTWIQHFSSNRILIHKIRIHLESGPTTLLEYIAIASA
jgi:hypothetical protein